MSKTLFGILLSELSEELITVSNPIYKDELPENVHTMHYQTNILPGSFTFHHVNQMVAKA